MTERDATLDAAFAAFVKRHAADQKLTPSELLSIIANHPAIAAYEQERAKDGAVAWRATYADGDIAIFTDKPTGDSGIYKCEPLYIRPSPTADVKAIRDELSRILGPQGTPSGPGLLNILTGYVVANSSADVKALEAKLAKAKEALKPFAVLADDYLADNVSFEDRVIMAGRIPRLREGALEPPKVTFADYRRARSTLSEIEDH